MNRIVILLIVTVALAGAVGFLYWDSWYNKESRHRRSALTQEVVPPLPDLDRSRAHRIEISDPNGKVELVRHGEQWHVPAKSDARAMEDRINSLLEGLEKVGAARSAVTRRLDLFDLQADRARRVTVKDASGNVLMDLYVGKQEQVREGTSIVQNTFVRAADREDVYSLQARLVPFLNTDPSLWIEHRFLPDLKPAEMNDLVASAEKIVMEFDDIQFAPKPGEAANSMLSGIPDRIRLVLEATEEEVKPDEETTGPTPPQAGEEKKPGEKERRWKVLEPAEHADLEVYTPMADSIVRMMAFARLDDVVSRDLDNPKYGLDRPVVEVTVSYRDGRTHHLRVGHEAAAEDVSSKTPDAKLRYATMSGNPFVVTMNQWSVSQLVKKPEALKKPGGTPAATPGRPGGEIKLPGEERKEKEEQGERD